MRHSEPQGPRGGKSERNRLAGFRLRPSFQVRFAFQCRPALAQVRNEGRLTSGEEAFRQTGLKESDGEKPPETRHEPQGFYPGMRSLGHTATRPHGHAASRTQPRKRNSRRSRLDLLPSFGEPADALEWTTV